MSFKCSTLGVLAAIAIAALVGSRQASAGQLIKFEVTANQSKPVQIFGYDAHSFGAWADRPSLSCQIQGGDCLLSSL